MPGKHACLLLRRGSPAGVAGREVMRRGPRSVWLLARGGGCPARVAASAERREALVALPLMVGMGEGSAGATARDGEGGGRLFGVAAYGREGKSPIVKEREGGRAFSISRGYVPFWALRSGLSNYWAIETFLLCVGGHLNPYVNM